MLSKYIKSLIDIHSRVIVPDLGAFMLKGDASKTVYFNEFLRFNDGLLVDYIADHEQIDKIEAAKKVKTFVDAINKQLSGNKSVELEGLGTLYLDINEKIQLRTSDTGPGAVVKQVEPDVETSPREVLFELEKTEPVTTATKPSATKEPDKTQATPSPTPEPSQSRKTEAKTPPAKQEKPAAKTKQDIVSPPPAKDSKPQAVKKENVTVVAPNTNKRMIFVGIFGVIVIGAIIYFAFFHSGKKDHNVNQNIIIGSTHKADSTKLKKDSSGLQANKAIAKKIENVIDKDIKQKEAKAQATTKVADNKVKTNPPTSIKKEEKKEVVKPSNGKKFYVIAGTFSVEANADRMVKKLKDEGYTPDKLKNESKNIFYISYSSFGDKESAREEMNKLKSSGKPDAWIYTK